MIVICSVLFLTISLSPYVFTMASKTKGSYSFSAGSLLWSSFCNGADGSG